MCSICWQMPCHPRCPNAPEPKPVYECSVCKEGIYPGDEYFEAPDGPVCYDCLDDMSVFELISLIGDEIKTAECEEMEEW